MLYNLIKLINNLYQTDQKLYAGLIMFSIVFVGSLLVLSIPTIIVIVTNKKSKDEYVSGYWLVILGAVVLFSLSLVVGGYIRQQLTVLRAEKLEQVVNEKTPVKVKSIEYNSVNVPYWNTIVSDSDGFLINIKSIDEPTDLEQGDNTIITKSNKTYTFEKP